MYWKSDHAQAPPQGQVVYPAPTPGYYYVSPPPPPPPYPEHYYNNTPSMEPQFETSFNTKEIRLMFVRKVYMILSIQLAFTTGVIALFLYETNTKKFVQTHPILLWISLGIFFVIYLTIICCTNLRRTFPTNIILLAIFTLAQAYLTATMSSFYSQESVLLAIGISGVVCIAVTVFAMQTKYDFTTCGVALMIATLILMIFSIFTIFFYDRIMLLVYSSLAALLFTVYLAFDTQLIMGGRTIEISPEEYVLAALMLYIDVIMIFMNIQRIISLGGSN